MTARVINCAICKKQFIAPKKTGSPPMFCSDECRHDARLISQHKYYDKIRLKETRRCAICGEQFIAEGRGGDRKRYCSVKCANRAENNGKIANRIKKAESIKCPQCEKMFKHVGGRTYCSHECYIESRRTKKKVSDCPVCGKQFSQSGNKRKYCSRECSAKAQSEVYRNNAITRRALRKTNGRIEKIIPKEIFERDGWKCQLCGKKVSKRLYKTKGTKRYPNAPSIDHIIPISKGGEHISSNVQCACYLCNCKKSNKVIGQARIF